MLAGSECVHSAQEEVTPGGSCAIGHPSSEAALKSSDQPVPLVDRMWQRRL